ncbi:glucose 1-dehydrogenase [Piscinibacter sakaiensis]|uniref:Toluenesulfonate zinc-independent alcohol dehydrogenase n=1 Tax=Piscinibacter sakaiensis TaxID=1547922 RepID=A0A0K8P1F4_PISS1|nr:glucose 1-dehydrogenase [Piscinibacter sakaiensis]GAP36461.1 toluenesulfonate zinc-independent alcohol dehydrogenase [Piscinibacter sakaiensis]
MHTLDGKVALVTGGAAGFGEGIVRAYVAAGARVLIADLAAERGTALAAELGEAAAFARGDVSQRADVDALVAACVERFGVPDIVVNNAGTTHDNQPMLQVDEAGFDRVFAVNVKSIFHMAHAVVPLMRERRRGVILNVGSTAGIRPRPGLTWYNASKGAVNLLSKSMAVELGPDNIRVNAICPVMGETGLLEKFMGVPDTPQNRARFLATIPLGRLSRASDVAAAALFLASDAAEFISGVEFPVDGARTV